MTIPVIARSGDENGAHEGFSRDRFASMVYGVTALTLLAAWTALSIPVAMAAGAVLGAASRRATAPVAATSRANRAA